MKLACQINIFGNHPGLQFLNINIVAIPILDHYQNTPSYVASHVPHVQSIKPYTPIFALFILLPRRE